MGTVRVSKQPWEKGTVFCPEPRCAAVAGEPCREPRGRGRGGFRFRTKIHDSRRAKQERAARS